MNRFKQRGDSPVEGLGIILLFGIVVFVLWGLFISHSKGKNSNKDSIDLLNNLKEKLILCEKELPRNQTCELIAVVKNPTSIEDKQK